MAKIKKYETIGVIVISILSLILGYIFLRNPGNYGFFNFLIPKNNSLWEISKILFLSLIIYAGVEYFLIGNKYENYTFAKGVSIVLAPIIFIFVTYLFDLLIGNVFLITHLITFLISVIFAQFVSYFFMNEIFYFRLMNVFGIFAIFALIVIFASYTASPELLPFFVPMERYETYIIR